MKLVVSKDELVEGNCTRPFITYEISVISLIIVEDV